MPALEAVTPTQHLHQYWHASPNYSFAAHDPLATLVGTEMPAACMHMPLGFSRVGEGFMPAALQGLQAQQNLWVDGQGRWRGGYIPAIYRAYPFALAHDNGKRILCIDRDSGLVSDDSDSGQPFFDSSKQPTERLQQIMAFLRQLGESNETTKAQCAVLEEQGVIQPWPLQVTAGERSQQLEGLYRIDETKLNGLSAEAFQKLREAGVLPMIYCQLLSMRHTHRLGTLARADQKAAAAQQQAAQQPDPDDGDLNLDFLNDSTIRFN